MTCINTTNIHSDNQDITKAELPRRQFLQLSLKSVFSGMTITACLAASSRAVVDMDQSLNDLHMDQINRKGTTAYRDINVKLQDALIKDTATFAAVTGASCVVAHELTEKDFINKNNSKLSHLSEKAISYAGQFLTGCGAGLFLFSMYKDLAGTSVSGFAADYQKLAFVIGAAALITGKILTSKEK